MTLTYLQTIFFLLKVWATLARDKVTATGRPSGMNATEEKLWVRKEQIDSDFKLTHN